jgi:hypothetical protein
MRPNRGGKRVPPGRGGYDFEIVELGPPVYHMQVPPAKYRGPLIPAGDGEGLPQRPAPDLTRKRSRVPLVPGYAEMAALPKKARAAFTARCIRRGLLAYPLPWKETPKEYPLLETAVKAAEQIAAGQSVPEIAKLLEAVSEAGTDTRDPVWCDVAAALDPNSADICDASHASSYAAQILFDTATIDTPLTAQLRCIRRDFVRLRRLARKEKWTDETPVPPEVFGPMWPEGVEPYWAVEPPPAPTESK